MRHYMRQIKGYPFVERWKVWIDDKKMCTGSTEADRACENCFDNIISTPDTSMKYRAYLIANSKTAQRMLSNFAKEGGSKSGCRYPMRFSYTKDGHVVLMDWRWLSP